MDKLRNNQILKTAWPIISQRWFTIFTIFFYLFFCWYYMGPAFTNCTDRIYGFGDSTGGPIWSNSLKPEQPLAGGQEFQTNYPVGDNLYSPIKYATLTQTVLLKSTTKIAGPVCGYNLVNIIGYLSTALIMFAFIYYLTSRRWIALLAGYVVAFPPYVQSKVGGHPSYGYASLLIAIIWLALHIIKEKKIKHGLALSAVLAACAYFDPYFILFAATILTPILVIWGIYAIRLGVSKSKERPAILKTLKVFAISFGLFFVLIAPLLFVRVHESKAINATLGSSRGDVKAAAMQCSNYPIDYLLPDPRNIDLVNTFGQSFIAKNISHRHWCGFGESRVSISLAMIAIVALGAVIIFWEKLNKRRISFGKKLPYNTRILIWSIGAIALFAFFLGLPPRVRGIITPSGVIVHFTDTWRIFAREFLVLNLGLTILFGLILSYFSRVVFRGSKYILPALLVGIFFVILHEYQITTPFKPLTFSYSQDAPSVYRQIRDTKDINVVAEYPLDRLGTEADSIVYYLTMQTVHKKKLFNTAIVNNPREKVQIALKDLTDPQTLPSLRELGIKYLVIHGSTEEYILSKTNQLELIGHDKPSIYALTMVHIGGTNDVVLAKIKDGPKTGSVLTLQKGFVINFNIMKNPLDTEFETIQDTELKLVPLKGKAYTKDLMPACFEAKMSAVGDTSELSLIVNGKLAQTASITDSYTPISVMAKQGDTILLHSSNGHNLRLNNLGCPIN